MNKPKRLGWTSAAASHVGMVRRLNEDACLALPSLGLWAVADGMGGHAAGEVASQTIIDALERLSPPSDWDAYCAAAQASLQQANQRLREESVQRYHHRIIGSTVVVLLAREDQGACLWVGDSRLYRLRNGQLEQLTRDHSHVQDLVDQGLISAEQALHHPLSNVITRAVGSEDTLNIDSRRFSLQAGDTFLLCSDGLYKAVSVMDIARMLTGGVPQEIAQALIHAALVRNADDNVTVVVIGVRDSDQDDDDDSTVRLNSAFIRPLPSA